MATAESPAPADNNKLSLLIVAKAKMKGGLCYMGYDNNTNKLIRPLLFSARKQCWERGNDFIVGETIIFNVTRRCPVQSSLPHRSDDFLVDRKVSRKNAAGILSPTAMFEALSEFESSFTVEEIFGNEDKTFVKAGTACPSVAIYSCKGQNVTLYTELVEDKKYGGLKQRRRCIIWEPLVEYDLSITAEESYEQPKGDDNVLLLLGLGRPLEKENEKRCYIFVIGMFTKPSDSSTPG